MVLVRLLVGLLKGLVIGALAGYGLAAAGFAMPGAIVAYGAAAALGVILACLAGKPIWAKGARIEVGAKALTGAVIAPLLLLAARRWLNFELPFDLPGLLGITVGSAKATIGAFSVTAYAAVAAVLAGFFDADNDPGAAQSDKEAAGKTGPKRIATQAAAPSSADPAEPDEEIGADRRKAEK